MYKNDRAFTLAEMMVVMLILTIILAAFAPLMTKRKAIDLSNPWRYAANNSDIYYGLAANQTAMIGQNTKDSSDPNSRLTISVSSASQSHFNLKNGNNLYANLVIPKSSSLYLGGPYKSSSNMSGEYNTSLGVNSLLENTSGHNNSATGYRALYSNTTGSYNTSFGAHSLYSNTTGNDNMAIGTRALYSNTTGSNNTAIGDDACFYVTTGSNKTCIGAGSGPSSSESGSTNTTKIIYLGSSDTIVHIPGVLVVDGSVALARKSGGRVYVRTKTFDNSRENLAWLRQENDRSGSRSITKVDHNNTLGENDVPSDRRLKFVGQVFNDGLDKIKEIKVFNFIYKSDPERTPHVGVIAQDLEKVFPDAVTKGEDGYLKIRTEDMFYALINSVKQLDTLVQGIINELKVHIERITNVENRVKSLEQENKLLKKQIADINKRLEKLEK